MNKNIFNSLLVLLLATTTFYLYVSLKKARVENRRLTNNSNALMSEIEQYTFRDSINVATIRVLSLKVSDYKNFRKKDAEIIEELGIKLKRLESASKSSTHTEYHFATPLNQQKIIYNSPYLNLKGKIDNDLVSIDLVSYDTITQIVHRVPRKFLFLKFGTKYLRQEIFSSNPHTKICYSEFIEIVK